MSAELHIDDAAQGTDKNSYDEQLTALFAVIEKLEDAVASAASREQKWHKEKKQHADTQTKLEKKLGGSDEDVKFIKERLDQVKKEKDQFAAAAKKERERIIGAAKKEQESLSNEVKELAARNKKLQQNMEKVTSKLDAAIIKIGELME